MAHVPFGVKQQGPTMNTRLLWTATLAAALATLFSTLTLAQERSDDSQSARAVKTTSQVVVWRIKTIGASKRFSAAKKARERLEKKVVDILEALDIKAADRYHEFPIMKRTFNSARAARPSGYSVRRTMMFVQRDADRFDEFFKKLAALESDYLFAEFSFKPSNIKLTDGRAPKSVVWKTTIVGGGNRLLRAKELFDQSLKEFRHLLKELGVRPEDVTASLPSMESRFSPKFPDKKPRGYTYQQTMTFKQENVEQFEALLTNLAERESDYFYFDFTVK